MYIKENNKRYESHQIFFMIKKNWHFFSSEFCCSNFLLRTLGYHRGIYGYFLNIFFSCTILPTLGFTAHSTNRDFFMSHEFWYMNYFVVVFEEIYTTTKSLFDQWTLNSESFNPSQPRQISLTFTDNFTNAFRWILSPGVQMMISQHWFCYWPSSEWLISHFLFQ